MTINETSLVGRFAEIISYDVYCLSLANVNYAEENQCKKFVFIKFSIVMLRKNKMITASSSVSHQRKIESIYASDSISHTYALNSIKYCQSVFGLLRKHCVICEA